MATLSRGATYGASETLTNTKLHNLVDLGSISQIVDADCSASMNLTDTKLADITTANKVKGTALGNLASIPSGAGIIPVANMPFLGSSYVSLVSIPNSSLLPINLTSWVDGAAMRNIQSMPSLAGQLAWYSIVSSLASGGTVMSDGTSKFVGSMPTSLRLVSRTTLSAVTNSGDISIDNTKTYQVYIDLSSLSVADSIDIRINNDTTATNYSYVYRGFDAAATASNGNSTGSGSIIMSAAINGGSGNKINIVINIYPQMGSATRGVTITGKVTGLLNSSGRICYWDFVGSWNATTTATSFRILTDGGSATMTGSLILYEVLT